MHVVLLAVHLLCVNVACAGPLVGIWLDWREGRGDRLAGAAGRYLAAASVVLLIVGAVLGVGLGAVIWDDDFRNVLRRIPSRVTFGVWEWIASLAILVAYYFWWKHRPGVGPTERVLRGLMAFAAGTNILYHFPILFEAIDRIAPEGEILSRAEFRLLLTDGYVLSRSTHFVLASFAASGVVLIGYALREIRQGNSDAERIGRAGGKLALFATLPQLLVGAWVVMTTPKVQQMAIMGRDALSSVVFIVSLVAAFYLMHQLGKVAFHWNRAAAIQSMAVFVLVVLLMSWVSIWTEDHGVEGPAAAPSSPQGNPTWPTISRIM